MTDETPILDMTKKTAIIPANELEDELEEEIALLAGVSTKNVQMKKDVAPISLSKENISTNPLRSGWPTSTSTPLPILGNADEEYTQKCRESDIFHNETTELRETKKTLAIPVQKVGFVPIVSQKQIIIEEHSPMEYTDPMVEFLEKANIGQDRVQKYVQLFSEQFVDTSTIAFLTEDQLRTIGIKPMGDIIKIIKEAKKIAQPQKLDDLPVDLALYSQMLVYVDQLLESGLITEFEFKKIRKLILTLNVQVKIIFSTYRCNTSAYVRCIREFLDMQP